jgi:hypothetical protein
MQAIYKCQNYEIWRRIGDVVEETSLQQNLCELGGIYAKVSGISENLNQTLSAKARKN